ncbi:MAG: cell division protein FtsZ [Candidatus ainarchaeum sp.]|nr:cell division protein FtsZ [Candidatus ainarchaeum sp.]
MFDSIIQSAKEDIKPVSDVEDLAGVRISVIGVGGAGCNSINRLSKAGIKSANTIAINTDGKHLKITEANQKILIGKSITRGLGAGGDANVARKVAEADIQLLRDEIGENELVFLCGGMGGGTGTGAAPVVARVAKEQGAIVVAMVTYPFSLERVRLKVAQEGLKNLVNVADTVVVIDNNRLTSYAPNLPIDDAFKLADSIIGRAVKGISDTIMFPSLINVDFADVRAVMKGGGLAMISLGNGSGVDKIDKVVKDTMQHPLLDVNYEEAKGCLLHLEGGQDLTLSDAITTGEKITNVFDFDANIKLGARVNPNLTDSIAVTAILTGVSSPNIFGASGGFSSEKDSESDMGINYL